MTIPRRASRLAHGFRHVQRRRDVSDTHTKLPGTHKYTPITFVPKTLFEQFRRTANQHATSAIRPHTHTQPTHPRYFLVINLMMLVGEFTDLYVNPIKRGPALLAIPRQASRRSLP